MTLRPVLMAFSAVAFMGALLVWSNEPPRASAIFETPSAKVITGVAEPYARPKGIKQVRVITDGGAMHYTDCVAMPGICGSSIGTRVPVSISAVSLEHDFFWPIKAESRGQVIVDRAYSAIAYGDFIERESGLYRLALLLGFALFGFGIWFGDRQALPLSSTSNPQN